MTIYKIKSSATRAAKKAHGDDYLTKCQIITVEGGFVIQVEEIKEFTPAPTPSIPALPAGILATAPKAPIPTPAIPKGLHFASPAASPVPTTQEEADKLADAALVNADPVKPRMSTCELPTKKVWHIADEMPGAKRKEVIAACVAQGIAYGTARTQYQHWFKCVNDAKSAPIAVIGKDGKVVMPK